MRLQLSLWAEDLSADETIDPFAVVTQLQPAGRPKKLGQTEVIPNTTAPDWTTIFFLEDFVLGKPIEIVVSLYSGKTSLGSCVFEVNSILGAPGSSLAKCLRAAEQDGSSGAGVIVTHVEPASNLGVVTFRMRGIGLANVEDSRMSWLDKSDPFYELQRLRQSMEGQRVWDVVYRSPFVKDNLNPKWPAGSIEVSTLCGGDYNQKIRLVVYDHESSGEHIEIGKDMITLQQLLDSVELTGNCHEAWEVDTRLAFNLSRNGQDAGKVVVVAARVIGAVDQPNNNNKPELSGKPSYEQDVAVYGDELGTAAPSQELLPAAGDTIEPTFAAYIAGGCELRVLVAIDATASNGDPRLSSSLHYFEPDAERRNAYEKCLYYICSLLAKYDSDQKFPVWGFGAKLKDRDREVNHCFSIGKAASGEADQVDGILKAYRETFRSGIVMSAPRDFSQVIARAAKHAKEQLEESQCYAILLIFTNGDPADSAKTIDALKEAVDAPLSLVIVGVGDGPFSTIQQIERDMNNNHRDMIRFVHYRALENDPTALTQAALEQIPNQLVTFFTSHKINPQLPTSVNEIVVQPYSEAADVNVPMLIDDSGEAIVIGEVQQKTKWQDSFKDRSMKAFSGGSKIMQEGNKFMRQNKRLVANIKTTAQKRFGIKLPI